MTYVSFVNAGATCSGVYHFDGDELTPAREVPSDSVCGIAFDDEMLYAVERNGQLVVTYRCDGRLAYRRGLPGDDGHSLLVSGGYLYVVDTGGGAIWRSYIPEIGPWEVVYDNGCRGGHHLNSIAFHNGDLYASAFGPNAPGGRAKCADGYVKNVTIDEIVIGGLRHPHSLLSWDSTLWFCESAAGAIRTIDGESWHVGNGYVRGLTPINSTDGNNELYVGTSRSRNASGGFSALYSFDIVENRVEPLVECGSIGPEIYAIVGEAGGS